MTLHEEIARAIRDGFGGRATVTTGPRMSQVHVPGFEEPVTVWNSDIWIPEVFGPAIPGIRLDVHTVLASHR